MTQAIKHACANPHCETRALIALNKLACPTCWDALPQPLQKAIYATWRTDRRAYARHVIEARALWYDAAQSKTQRGGTP